MAKTFYFPVNGTSKKCRQFYAPVNEVSDKIVKAYCSVNGLSKLFWDGGGAEEQILRLYWYGDQCTAVTGGWRSRAVKHYINNTAVAPQLQFNANSFTSYQSVSIGSWSSAEGVVETVNTIDVRGYKTVHLLIALSDCRSGRNGGMHSFFGHALYPLNSTIYYDNLYQFSGLLANGTIFEYPHDNDGRVTYTIGTTYAIGTTHVIVNIPQGTTHIDYEKAVLGVANAVCGGKLRETVSAIWLSTYALKRTMTLFYKGISYTNTNFGASHQIYRVIPPTGDWNVPSEIVQYQGTNTIISLCQSDAVAFSISNNMIKIDYPSSGNGKIYTFIPITRESLSSYDYMLVKFRFSVINSVGSADNDLYLGFASVVNNEFKYYLQTQVVNQSDVFEFEAKFDNFEVPYIDYICFGYDAINGSADKFEVSFMGE